MCERYDIGNYKSVRVLGEGRYATVYEGMDKRTSGRVAIKVLSKMLIDGANPEFINNERRVFGILKDRVCPPTIIKFIEYLEDRENSFFVLEYYDGYTLQRVVYESMHNRDRQRLTKEEKKGYLLQIGDALRFLHSINIFHCDLKPENVIIRRKELKICDFGCAIVTAERTATARKLVYSSTPGYGPPETFDMSQTLDLEAFDTWSMMCLVFYTYTARQPFARDMLYNTIRTLTSVTVNYSSLPRYVEDACRRVFVPDKDKRIHFEEVMRMISEFPT